MDTDGESVPAVAPPSIVSCIKLSGHTDTVTSVGFNFNGSLALTGGYDGVVRIWKVETGELVTTLEGPEDVEWAQWHNKGNAVVAGSRDGTIWMWLTHNGQCVHVFAGHDGGVTCGTFTKDGKLICTGGEDGTVRQWNPKTGQCRHVFGQGDGHDSEVTCVVSGGPDADLLLSGTYVGNVENEML
jgi:angio-associated migratory cell protein